MCQWHTARLAQRFQRVFRHIHHHDHTIGQILSGGGKTSGGHTPTSDGRGSSALPDALPGCIREIWLLERDSRRKRCGWDSLVAVSQFAPPELRSSAAARRIDPSGKFHRASLFAAAGWLEDWGAAAFSLASQLRISSTNF